MHPLSEDIIQFFQRQGCVIVSSIDSEGFPHSACKGIVKINKKGSIFLLDAYRGQTLQNLKSNPSVNITAFDEHKFIGYCLKGKARILGKADLDAETIQAWEDRITGRLTQRLLKNIRGEVKGHLRHPEVLLPDPEHMIIVEVSGVIDLTPQHLK
ncbi:MAG: pyridoxamine 5'-phosphate oxidase family protein [Candidatus Omnitrophica bacterium]|jgi:general stress protein 26|nr:pyridoxamine 5'-phosphate oxidase family protein [Candidatus Omnitrophota bacterium]